VSLDPTVSGGPWLPDGVGLDDLSRQIAADHGVPVHLRVTAPGGSYPRWACGGSAGLGQFWTGKADEVDCPACLEFVHA
jgi:hypothetical protein